MKKTPIWICVCLFVFVMSGCDQTFLICRGEKVLVDTSKEVHHYWPQTIEKKEPEFQSTGIGKTTPGKTTDIENPDKRMITFEITADYPEGTLTPDSIMVDGKAVPSDNLYDTGAHTYNIQKAGYYSLEDTIPAGTQDHTISKKMECKPREIRFKITDSQTGQKVNPKVFIGIHSISEGEKVKPGQKALKIEAPGYEPLSESLFILPVGEGAYDLVRSLVPAKKVEVKPETIILQLRITGDYPKGEEISPEVVLVDNKEVRSGDPITPGSHRVTINQPAYEPYQADFKVPAGISTYTLNAELITSLRALEVAIRYDVYPSPQQDAKLGPCQISLINLDTNEQKPAVKTGDKVKPGTYELLVRRQAYTEIRDKIRIWPAVSPYKIEKEMEAKLRVVRAEVDFDIYPPSDLEAHVLDFIDVDTKVRRTVRPDGTIKPGKYSYIVSKAGYQMVGGSRNIVIEPDESPFLIQAKMAAEPRQISFDATYQGVLVRAKEITIDNKPCRFEDRYRPGKYHVVITFDNYRTIERDIEVVPGVGPYVVKLTLTPK